MDLNISFDETISLGNQVTEKGGTFQELLNKVKATNNELKSYWEGQDASKYSTAVEQQIEYMQQLSDTIAEIGEFLVKVGNAYKEAQETNSNGIK